jgi:hypothetical protein
VPAGRDAEEDDLGHVSRMCLGVGERQRAAPGAAENEPAVDAEMGAVRSDSMSAMSFAVVLFERSVAGSPTCGVLRPQLRWSNSTIRYTSES